MCHGPLLISVYGHLQATLNPLGRGTRHRHTEAVHEESAEDSRRHRRGDAVDHHPEYKKIKYIADESR